MTGFFTHTETQSKERPDGKSLTCYSCGLYRNCETPKMQPCGNFKKGILNIGTFPSLADDMRGKPFQGRVGQLLQATYSMYGIDLFEDCLNVNAVNCLSDKDPTNYHVDCCRASILRYIEKYKPKVIILFGIQAVYSLIGNRWKGALNGIDQWRGWTIPDQDFQTWICPVFAPEYVDKIDKPEVYKVWETDLGRALTVRLKELPVPEKPTIKVIDDLEPLTKIEYGSITAFDYETTGLKPHAKGHRIVCCSIATDEDNAFVFEMPNLVEKCKPFIDFLRNKSIRKMAHNLKFEESWSYERLKTRVRGWYWDSMLAAHLLDNRAGITGLKFQTYVNFGIVNYNETVSPWLQAVDSKNANSLNRLQEFFATKQGREETLKYCALDSIYEYRLALKQQKEIVVLSLPF